jgi:hypothetical protein
MISLFARQSVRALLMATPFAHPSSLLSIVDIFCARCDRSHNMLAQASTYLLIAWTFGHSPRNRL